MQHEWSAYVESLPPGSPAIPEAAHVYADITGVVLGRLVLSEHFDNNLIAKFIIGKLLDEHGTLGMDEAEVFEKLKGYVEAEKFRYIQILNENNRPFQGGV